MKVKFRNMPLGGRFNNFGRIWAVLEHYGDGLVASESLEPAGPMGNLYAALLTKKAE